MCVAPQDGQQRGVPPEIAQRVQQDVTPAALKAVTDIGGKQLPTGGQKIAKPSKR